MGTLAAFRNSAQIVIPRPLCARDGDVFQLVCFDEDAPVTWPLGSSAVVLLNSPPSNGLYVVNVRESFLVAQLSFAGAFSVHCQSLHRSFPSRSYSTRSLNILGRIIEIYPLADMSVRWVEYANGQES